MMKPEVSIPVGLATAVLVLSVYQHAMPSYVDHRQGEPGDTEAASAEKVATWTAAGLVSAISLVAKDPVVFMIGGTMVIVASWWHKHANAVNPITGKAFAPNVKQLDDSSTAMPADLAYTPA